MEICFYLFFPHKPLTDLYRRGWYYPSRSESRFLGMHGETERATCVKTFLLDSVENEKEK